MDSHNLLISYFVLVIAAFAIIWVSAWLELDDEREDNDANEWTEGKYGSNRN